VNVVRALVLALVVALVVPTLAGARGGADVRAIRAVLHQQMTLLKQGKYRSMYALTTQRYRANCPYVKFVATNRALRQKLGPTALVDRIQVKFLAAKQAQVAYRFLKNRRPYLWVRFGQRDTYTKVGRRWFDDYDGIACRLRRR
jgi:hypothetical protein